MKSGLMKGIKKLKIPFDFSDIILLLGAGSVFYGAYLVYKPSAFILLGAGLIYFAIKPGGNKPNGYAS